MHTQDDFLPVKGVRLSAVAAGIRYKNRDDLVLVEMAEGTEVAAMFTTNAFCAAPVTLARQYLAAGKPRYLLINSGNANAGTGKAGYAAAVESCEAVSAQTGCDTQQVLPFSTGVIGELLPVEKITSALAKLHQGLDQNAWQPVAEAIMTTDTVPKLISRQVEIDGKALTINGIAKGSGMIRPNMATMLSYIATDARVAKDVLQESLEHAVNHSFNRITVDGDTSTNDAVVLMATGQGDVHITDANRAKFQEVLDEVCNYLARAIVLDGEGATKLINIVVEKGASEDECAKVAYAIAHSPLVKTAFFASDPNWGRILAAVGYAGVPELEIDDVQLYLDDVCIVEAGGRADSYTEEQGQQVMQQSEITIRVVLNRGTSSATVWTCDFSYDYVKINADYRS
jgi:glutamate N-acetyltransferase/amino-acid N-acetyltransferase